MYLFYLTLKTGNCMIALGIFAYSVVLAVICPALRRREKYLVPRILCILPAIAAFVHWGIYGNLFIRHFKLFYLEALIPVLFIFNIKSAFIRVIRSVMVCLSAAVLCFAFILNSISAPMVHNYTRYSYTESFKKMLKTMEQEYCLNSWKEIDYDELLETYLPRVAEAERNRDEAAYSAIVTEVTYYFYDSHVGPYLTDDTRLAACEYLSGNDYGLSMIRIDDGSVIAVLVEPGCEAATKGIHDGTTIISWDNRDINEAVEDVECIYPGLSFPVEENEDIFRPIFLAGKGGESVSITVLDDSGDERSISVQKTGNYEDRLSVAIKCLLHDDDDYQNFYSCMLDDRCGYLQITSESYDALGDNISAIKKGYYPELTEYYADLIENLENKGMKYLIIDIRNNGGGYDSVAGALASLFTDKKSHMVSFGYEDAQGYHVAESQYIFPDGRYADIPVVVLVNSNCMSAGDGMAKFLGDCPNVTLMGITASSGVNQNNGGYIYLTDNICVYYPVFLSLSEDGEPFIDTDHTRENKIPLDVAIPITGENAKTIFSIDNYDREAMEKGKIVFERDVELEYAVRYLLNRY